MKQMLMLMEWVLTSAALILVVTILRALLGKRVSAGLRYALWAVVLVRLLVPVQLFSIPVPAVLTETGRGETVELAPPSAVPAPGGVENVGQPVLAVPAPNTGTEAPAAVPAPAAPKADPLSVWRVLGWLWLSGSVVMGLAFLISNIGFARRLRRARAAMAGADGHLPVYTALSLPSPCLFGLFRPAVYVTPEAAADPSMLRHVLAHEYTHFRHGDHIWNALRSAALAIHWWNPLVWWAVVVSRRDCELACDEGALKRLGEGERIAYGRTLLALLTEKPRASNLLTCATTMTGGQKSVWERVTRIAHAPKRWLWAAVAMVLAAAVACVCAFGQAAEPETALEDLPPEPETAAPVETVPVEPAPVLSTQPNIFSGGLDFEFYAVGVGTLRFSNLTQAVTSSTDVTFRVKQYTILDLNRDGAAELVLALAGQGGYIILHKTENGIYGYHTVVRGLQDLKADGTFRGSSGAGDWGYYTILEFDDGGSSDGMKEEKYTWCESAENGELYFVDGTPATRWEFEATAAIQDAKEDAPWRLWTEDSGGAAVQWLEDAGVVWLEVTQASVRDLGDGELLLTHNGKEKRFTGEWDHYFPDETAEGELVDLDGDGRCEIAVTLRTAHGTGCFIEELHLFDEETLDKYDCSDLVEEVISHISSTGDNQYFYLSAPGMETVAIPKSAAWAAADHIQFGDYVDYMVEGGQLYCSLGCDMGRLEYCGDIKVGIALSGGRFVPTSFEYISLIELPPGSPAAYAAEQYRKVLQGRSKFTLHKGQPPVTLGEALGQIDDDPFMKYCWFTVVDMDGNGTKDVLVYACGAAGDCAGYILLSQGTQGDGEVYGTVFNKNNWGNRWFQDLKIDGTFERSDALGTEWSSISALRPAVGGYTVNDLAVVRSSNHEEWDGFEVDGKEATEVEYKTAKEAQDAKPNAVWYDFTPENIVVVLQY